MLRHNFKALAVGVGMGVCAAGAGLVALKKSGILGYALDRCYDALDVLYETLYGDEEDDYEDYISEMEADEEDTIEDEDETEAEDEAETETEVETKAATETRSTDANTEDKVEDEDYTIKAFAQEMFGAFQKFCEEHPIDNYLKHYATKCNEGIDKLHCVAEGVIETAKEGKHE